MAGNPSAAAVPKNLNFMLLPRFGRPRGECRAEKPIFCYGYLIQSEYIVRFTAARCVGEEDVADAHFGNAREVAAIGKAAGY